MNGERKVGWGWRVFAFLIAAGALFAWYCRKEPRPALVAVPTLTSGALSPKPQTHLDRITPRALGNPTAENAEEICGIGRAPVTNPLDTSMYVSAQTRAARDRWESALLNSADLRARAVGLVLQQFGREVSPDLALRAAEARDELVQLAVGSNDPTVYALAVAVCDGRSADSAVACSRISLTEWARLDPDNVIPWLALARTARAAGDARAEATDFAHAAQAQKVENAGLSLLALAQSEVPQDFSPLEKAESALEFIGLEGAWIGPQLGEPSRYCMQDALGKSDVATQCNNVAALLVSRGRTLLEFSMGLRLGERLGWPQDRLSALSQERSELFKLLPAEGHDQWSCDSVARTNEFMEKRVQMGEMQALRYFRDRSR